MQGTIWLHRQDSRITCRDMVSETGDLEQLRWLSMTLCDHMFIIKGISLRHD